VLQGSGCGCVGRRGVGRGTTPPLPARVRSGSLSPSSAKTCACRWIKLHGFLLIWLVLEQDPRDHQPQPGLQALAFGPVQKQVLAKILGLLVGDSLEHVLVSVSSPGSTHCFIAHPSERVLVP
jgi:hypothetical protein